MNDALEIPSPAELYAAYEEVVAQARAGGVGQAPARWADAGRIAYLLYVASQDTSAARLCQEAYRHLFPPPGTEAASPGGAEVDALPRHRVLAAFAGNQVHAEGRATGTLSPTAWPSPTTGWTGSTPTTRPTWS